MRMKQNYILFSLIFLASVSFFSCKNKSVKMNSEGAIQLLINDSEISDSEIASAPINHSFSEKKIIVLLGYSFNAPEIKNKMLGLLEQKYGFTDCGAMIFPLCFPDDFKRSGHSYATELYSIISDPLIDVAGIVLIGAPEYTHLALAKNQDDWEQEVPYPVIALFPQDDTLGIESTCNFILDKTQTAEEEDFTPSDEYFELILQVIDYISMGDFEITDYSDPIVHVAHLLKENKFHNFTDSETGLKSINHFVLN